MNLKSMIEKLNRLQVSPRTYSINKEWPSDKLCLFHNGKEWEVYFSERGVKSGLKKFRSEEKACRYFFDQVMNYWDKVKNI